MEFNKDTNNKFINHFELLIQRYHEIENQQEDGIPFDYTFEYAEISNGLPYHLPDNQIGNPNKQKDSLTEKNGK